MNNLVLQSFRSMQPRPADAWVFEDPKLKAQLEQQILMFPAMALPSLEAPTVVCGLVHAHGVGEIWMITGKGFERSAPVVLQQQKHLCKSFYKALKLHRMDIRVEAIRSDALLWAGRLGFEYETTLKRAHPLGGDVSVFLWPETTIGEDL